MSDITSLGLWIKRRRKALDLTQDALAALVGCSKDLIVKIEGDARRPSREIAALLATQLQLAPEERDDFIRCARAELTPDKLPSPTQSTPRAAFVPAATTSAPMPHDRSGTLTFLFTDIVGSTRLWEQQPDAMRAALAHHDQILRQAIGSNGGQVFKTVGDAFYAVFSSPSNALHASLAAQRVLGSAAWAAFGLSGPIQVRMALHAGAAEWRDGDYFGPSLNRVARLLAAGHGGQVLLSAAAQALLVDQLPPDVTLRDLGSHRLKDLSRPEQIYQAQVPDLPSEFPPLRTLDARSSNLPIQPTPLIGRERELARVTALLGRPEVRLVTLTGPGGTGKTRLGLQSAAELLERFHDGVFFVDLAPISDPALVVVAIAQTLGLLDAGSQPLRERLKSALQTKELLLLLDNFEQVLQAAPVIAELLMAAAGLKVLITSRVVLHLSGEHEYAVSPLALPPANATTFDADLAQYAAIALFIARAQAAKADFALTDANAPAVVEICVRLDGLPLAIELAAARVKLFSAHVLLNRLSTPLALLTGGARDMPARQQTIRSTIEWSYTLLSAEEQQLFRSLGVFVGGFTLAAAEAISQATRDPRFDVLTGLATLVDHSLVRSRGDVDGEPRYDLLELVHEYALEQVRAAGEEGEIRRRHAAYFAAWGEQVQPGLYGADVIFWLDRLGVELGNFRVMLDWSLSADGDDALYSLRLFGSLWELWFLRYPAEGAGIARRALLCASARRQDRTTARIYNAAARLGVSDTAFGNDRTLLERSLALARQFGDRLLQAEVLNHLGEIVHGQADLDAAEHVLMESVQISRELNATYREGWATLNLGGISQQRGDTNAAERYTRQALALFTRLSNPFGMGFALYLLSRLAERRGDRTTADDLRARADTLMNPIGPTPEFSPVINRGHAAYRRGDYQVALELLQSGYDQARQGGYREPEVHALILQAACYLELDGIDMAINRCRLAQALVLEHPWPPRMVTHTAIIIANVAVTAGKHRAAARLLGCTAVFHASISYQIEHDSDLDWQRLYDRALSACRAQLSEVVFAAAWAEGQELPLDQAVDEALTPV